MFLGIVTQSFTQCNGLQSLCNKKFDEAVYVTTHNAFNYNGPFSLPNQFFPVSQQLQEGVRGLMIDVYEVNGVPTVYHGFSFLGTQPLSLILNEVKSFLDNNPNEIVSIIFESYVSGTMMETAFSDASLLPYLHTQPPGQAWPTLQEMINDNKRLVVFTDETDNSTALWYHDVWNFAVETEFSIQNKAEFTCDFNRGDSLNSLFILNHFITNPTLGTGLPDSALIINEYSFLLNRSLDCYQSKGKIPNFITVDFYDQGDPFEVANLWNSSYTTPVHEPTVYKKWEIYPNPCESFITLFKENNDKTEFEISDIYGKKAFSLCVSANSTPIRIETGSWTKGLYFVRDLQNQEILKLEVAGE